jgi:DNA-binding NtrC family response regulator
MNGNENSTAPPSGILVVDDEALIRWSLRERLQAAGYRVLEAATGGQALDLLGRDLGIDLVLLDLRLPDTDGLTLLKQIRGCGSRRPVIVMTACRNADTVDEAQRCGASDVVDKPFAFDLILSLVRSTLVSGAAPARS